MTFDKFMEKQCAIDSLGLRIVCFGMVGMFAALTIAGFNGCLKAQPRGHNWDLLGRYFISVGNGVIPIEGVWQEGHGSYPLTNWLCVTSATSPKVITSILKAPRTVTASAGQLWFGATACYINVPKVTEWVGETNGLWVMPTHQMTNDWPQISQSFQLILVRSAEDYYARCRVRLWTDSAFVESDATILLSSLTNNCTLIK